MTRWSSQAIETPTPCNSSHHSLCISIQDGAIRGPRLAVGREQARTLLLLRQARPHIARVCSADARSKQQAARERARRATWQNIRMQGSIHLWYSEGRALVSMGLPKCCAVSRNMSPMEVPSVTAAANLNLDRGATCITPMQDEKHALVAPARRPPTTSGVLARTPQARASSPSTACE